MNPEKVDAMMSYEKLPLAKEVRSFLSMLGYYRRFVEGFSSLAISLTRLTKKNIKFEWNDECEMNFTKLKK